MIFQRPLWRGLYTEGKFRYKIGWAFNFREICVSKSMTIESYLRLKKSLTYFIFFFVIIINDSVLDQVHDY